MVRMVRFIALTRGQRRTLFGFRHRCYDRCGRFRCYVNLTGNDIEKALTTRVLFHNSGTTFEKL